VKKSFIQSLSIYDDKWRVRFLLAILFLIAVVLLGRVLQLMVFDRSFLQHQGDVRTMRVIPIPAHRGMILDRNHYPLAISTPVFSIWVNPQQFSFLDPNIPALASLLGENINQLHAHVNDKTKRDFVYLKRQVPPAIADKVKALKIPGVYFVQEYQRFYPDGEVTAPLLGFTNIDDQGQEGLELAYNSTLQGIPGKERVQKDLYGHVVAVEGLLAPAKPGQNIVLSIDHRIQYLAYSNLVQAIAENNAESGSVVVIDVKTGEILAMANAPSFNPNMRPKHRSSNYRNRAVTDVFEPGSTMKTFAAANALQSGKYKPDTLVDTSPGWMYLNGHRVQEDTGANLGVIDVRTILQHSSNMGISRITLSLPPNSLYEMLHKVGFGQSTNSGFPGEVNGVLVKQPKWADIVLATLSFGYGVSVTTVQLAQAYAMLADSGVKHPVSLLKLDGPPASERILNANVANELVDMLQSVVAKGGTATAASIPGYKVSGKTGTVRIIGPHGYELHHHIGIFAGIVPVSNPRLVAVVMIRNPQNKLYFGGDVSAPVFSKVMAGALRDLNIPPDNLNNAQPNANVATPAQGKTT
jgi:cell division protein FtsI (penicillin-binding protein 3)